MGTDKREPFELLEFSLSFCFLSCTMLVYARARNTAASIGTGRRAVRWRTFGKRENLAIIMMNWTVRLENNKKYIPIIKLMMPDSNILRNKITDNF